MKKILSVLLVALTAAGASACGAAAPTAVTVNGTEISVASIDDELEAIRDNVDYRRGIEAGNQAVLGQGSGTIDAAFAARVVSLATYYELVRQEVRRRKVDVTEAERTQARNAVYGQLGVDPSTGAPDAAQGQKVFAKFPKSYQDKLVAREADLEALQADLVDVDVSPAAVQRFYDDNADRFLEVCARHILVDTEATAREVKQELESGTDFARLAGERSKDESAAQNGGDLGCASPSSYVPEFAGATSSQPVGVVGEPVQTQFGFHIIVVYKRDVTPLDQVREQIVSELQGQGSSALNEWLTKALAAAKVNVNPRFGTWDPNATPIPRVNPPTAPTTVPAPTVPGSGEVPTGEVPAGELPPEDSTPPTAP